MKKKLIALVLLTVFALTMTGCGAVRTVSGPDLEKPVFVKQLTYTDEMDLDLSYIQDYNWDKEISKISLVDGPKEASCRVYDYEEYQEDDKYTLVRVDIGIGSSRTDDEGNLPEDIEFSKVKVTWDDGSQTTEDVGHIVISSDDFDYDMIDESGDSDMGETYVTLEPTDEDVEITGLNFRLKEAGQYFTDILFDETPLDEISVRHPLKLREGESATLTANSDRSTQEYGTVSVAADVMKRTKSGQKVYATVFLGWDLWEDGNIKDYLKAVLES